MPHELALLHLSQCAGYMKSSIENPKHLLYTASLVHLGFHTILVIAYSGTSDVAILGDKWAKQWERDSSSPMEGVQLKSFSRIFTEAKGHGLSHYGGKPFSFSEVEAAIEFVRGIRNGLEHPAPGPGCFWPLHLIESVALIAQITAELWCHPSVTSFTRDDSHKEAATIVEQLISQCEATTTALRKRL
jgi:hypothetical protein